MNDPIMWMSVFGVAVALIATGYVVWRRKKPLAGAAENVQDSISQYRLQGDYRKVAELLVERGQLEKAAHEYARLGDHASAAKLFERTRDREMAALHYKKAGILDEAIRCFEKAGMHLAAAETLEEAGDIVQAARLLESHGEHRRAVSLLRGAGEEEAALRIMASEYARIGNGLKAAECYTQINDFEQAATLYKELGHYDKAGHQLLKLGRAKEAIDCLLAAGNMEAAAEAWLQTGNPRNAARLFLRAGDVSRSVELLKSVGDHATVGRIFLQFGHMEEASDSLASIQSEDPNYLESVILLAKIAEQRNLLTQAKRHYLTAVEHVGLNPTTRPFLVRVVELCFRLQLPAEARKHVERLKQANMGSQQMEEELAALEEIASSRTPSSVDPAHSGARLDPNKTAPPRFNLPQHARYTFEKELARGAQGVVYLAKDDRLDRPTVVKLLGNISDEMARHYFEREALTAARLNHPHIVTIYDVGELDNTPFIAMEYVDGETLKTELSRTDGPLDFADILQIVRQLTEALDFAHSNQVIHRDLKPENVMRTLGGEVKLMDFGLAKALTRDAEQSVLLVGTPYYMAPEQIVGDPIDNRADIYALGVMLFLMFTGRLPFQEGNVLSAHRSARPPSPQEFNPAITDGISRVILRCLAKDRKDRYESAGEMFSELREECSGAAKSA